MLFTPKSFLSEELEGEECFWIFILVDFKFENWILKNGKRPQGHEIGKL
jgi:hypothetical protein